MIFGLQGFRWVFVLHNHLGPANNLALDQAADYFHDTYGGRFDSRSVPRVSAASSIPPYEVEQQKRQLEWLQKHGGLR